MIKSKVLWGLVWVNLILLIGWALKLSSPTAVAQLRRPSDYLMIPGNINGGSAAVIYIVDQTEGRLTAVSFDDSSGRLTTMTPLDLNQLFQAAAVVPQQGARKPGF